jgi:hypothetical protein
MVCKPLSAQDGLTSLSLRGKAPNSRGQGRTLRGIRRGTRGRATRTRSNAHIPARKASKNAGAWSNLASKPSNCVKHRRWGIRGRACRIHDHHFPRCRRITSAGDGVTLTLECRARRTRISATVGRFNVCCASTVTKASCTNILVDLSLCVCFGSGSASGSSQHRQGLDVQRLANHFEVQVRPRIHGVA